MNYLENISLKKLITLIKTEIKTNSGGSADRVTYDNTASGLAGSNVQEAIDELAGGVLPEDIVFYNEEDAEASTSSINADTVGGYTVDLLLDKIYPVGSIYMSLNSVDPSALFGGTWTQIKDTFLLSAGDTYAAGATGGEAEHNHIYGLKVYEYYSMAAFTPKGTETGAINIDDGTMGAWSGGSTMTADETLNASLSTTTASQSSHHYESRANTSTESNMPPYLAVYVWQRIS